MFLTDFLKPRRERLMLNGQIFSSLSIEAAVSQRSVLGSLVDHHCCF